MAIEHQVGTSVPGLGLIVKAADDPELSGHSDLILVVRKHSVWGNLSQFMVMSWPHGQDEPINGNLGTATNIEDALLVFDKTVSQLTARKTYHKFVGDAIGTDSCLECGLNPRFIKHNTEA